jgi:DNA repair exonuclease SbcCD ATPase subunit
MADDTQSVVPVIKTAGATTFDTVGMFLFRGYSFWHVPFYRDKSVWEREVANTVVERNYNPKKTILLFHEMVRGSQLNVQVKAEDGITLPSSNQYVAAFGGHVHLHQQLARNVWYVGSPFAQDWGEANQPKGFMLATIDVGKVSVKFLPSDVPGYYDPELPGFTTPPSGARVRVRVPYSTRDGLQTVIKRAEEKVLTTWGDKVVPYIVPEKKREGVDTELGTGELGNDADLTFSYLKRNPFPKPYGLEQYAAYLQAKLGRTGGVANGFRFEKVTAENYVCFKRCELTYTSGLTLVTGENQDWDNSSNGAGKSSLLALPAVAMFGRTTKQQKNDQWCRQGTTGATRVTLTGTLPDNRTVEILRQRRPPLLEVRIDNVDHTMGNLRQTQDYVEKLTGLTWDVLINGLYVEQAEVNLLVRGTDKQRKELFASFLGIDRFLTASQLVNDELKYIRKRVLEVADDKAVIRAQLDENKRTRERLQSSVDWKAVERKIKDAKGTYAKEKKKLDEESSAIEYKISDATEVIRNGRSFLIGKEKQLTACNYDLRSTNEALKRFEQLKGKCTLCGRKVAADEFTSKIQDLQRARQKILLLLEGLQKSIKDLSSQINKSETLVETLTADLLEVSSKERELQSVVTAAETEWQQAQRVRELAIVYKDEATVLRKKLTYHKEYEALLAEELAFLTYCVTAMGRNGIPAYLIACTCPRLNASAAYYSQLFAMDALTVEFGIVDDAVDVTVSNVYGGAQLADQSAGETRIASLIAAFALRDVLSGYNVLVLDEPGEGLDSQNAKRFAQGVGKLVKRFGSVYLTTHNPFIIAELSPDRVLQVVKRDRLASIVEAN